MGANSESSLITLGRAHAELFMIRQIANQMSLGMWLPEASHQFGVAEIAKIADRLIGELMEAYDKAKGGQP